MLPVADPWFVVETVGDGVVMLAEPRVTRLWRERFCGRIPEPVDCDSSGINGFWYARRVGGRRRAKQRLIPWVAITEAW